MATKVEQQLYEDVLPALHVYGEGTGQLIDGDAEAMMSRMTNVLYDAVELSAEFNSLVMNAISQLNALYNRSSNHYQTTFKYVKLFSVFDMLGDILRCLVVLDSVVAENPDLLRHWDLYKKMLRKVHDNY